MIGVYEIKVEGTNLKYIGSSIDINHRFKRHIREAKQGIHHSYKFQEAFDKYGEPAFKLSVILECSKEYLKIIEQVYMDSLDWDDLLNTSKTATCGDLTSYHRDKEEIIQKRTSTQRKVMETLGVEGRKLKYGKVREKNPNWKGGVTYCSCGNKKAHNATKCIKCTDRSGELNSFYGKEHTAEVKEKIRNSRLGKKPSNALLVEVDGIIYGSMTEASKAIGCSVATISNRLKSSPDKYKLINA